jgi:hypothetical protein|tara:strand:+ start:936 stop:1049 length:114 start_codon:yes stop_codon:yes gene_type:complete
MYVKKTKKEKKRKNSRYAKKLVVLFWNYLYILLKERA